MIVTIKDKMIVTLRGEIFNTKPFPTSSALIAFILGFDGCIFLPSGIQQFKMDGEYLNNTSILHCLAEP